MQIIRGKKRGAKLIAPKTSAPTRPTSGRAREALFNMLSNPKYGVFKSDLIVADIFAGTGALGLEAWSRGASEIIFIENNADALFALHANITKLGAKENVTVIAQDATRPFNWHTKPAQLVFCDPPWQKGKEDTLIAKALNNLIGMNALAPKAIIAIEHDYRSTPELPSQLKIIETRHWSKTAYTIGTVATVATNGD